jgi:hypothetical protein
MLKEPTTIFRLTPKQIIILLIIAAAGLIYLSWPQIRYSSASWLQPSVSLTAPAESALDTAPASDAWVALTRMPTPDNSALAAARVPVATATGTPTPAPAIVETSLGVSPRPLVANQATADYQEALARAEALINGMAASPDSQLTTRMNPAATHTATPRSTLVALVVVTETPTPQNMITAAAEAARATVVATAIGTYTPMPWNWVVPIVVEPDTPTPIPANAATAAFQVAVATAAAFVNGTPTPVPINVWTVTPTPFLMPVAGEVATPWIPPTPTPLPLPIPPALVGKIMFLSDRSGGPEPLPEPLVYVIDPDGSNLAVLNDDAFYQTAKARDSYSADQQYRTFTQLITHYFTDSSGRTTIEIVQAVFMYSYQYKVDQQITFFGTGEAWNPVWSPTKPQIAFVSDESDHAEIWTVNSDGSNPLQITKTDEALFASQLGKDTLPPGEELDEEHGHPSWSPDGTQIVFWSSLHGHRQIWVMNADGSNAYSLSTTGYDDWDPVWVKHTDPARMPEFGIKFPPSNATPEPDRDKGGEDDDRRPTRVPRAPEEEPPGEEPPGEEPPGGEPPGEEPPGEEPPGEEPPGEEPPGEEPPGEEPPGEEPPGEEPPGEEPPGEEPPGEGGPDEP